MLEGRPNSLYAKFQSLLCLPKEKPETDALEKPATGPTPPRGVLSDYNKQMIITLGGVDTGVRNILNKVLGILEQGLSDVARARDTVIDTNKRNIADVSWIKVFD